MSRELLHLVVLIDEGIEVNRSQIKHCRNMEKLIKENILPEKDPDHILAAGAILGWGIGSSGIYITDNIKKLINILDTLELDIKDLEDSNQPLKEGPDQDVFAFVEKYMAKAEKQIDALTNIKSYLLSESFDSERLNLVYSEKGKDLLEADFEESLKKLLED